MFRFVSRGVMAVVVVLALVLTSAPTVAAHWADGGGVCNGSVKIVIFDGHGETGADDDFCFYPYYSLAQDPDFSVNNTASTYVPDDDFGNRYLMDGFVSSISIQNDSNLTVCVTWFDSINFSGLTEYEVVNPGGHLHHDFWLTDNWYESMKVHMGTNPNPNC